MQGDPNRSQEILSANKHYYADVFLVVGFKYIERSLDDIPLCSRSAYWMYKSCFCPLELGFPQPALTNK